MADAAPITAEQIDAIIPFLETFESPSFHFGEMKTPEGELPWYDLSDEAHAFIKCLYDNNWVVPFDWGAWQDEAIQFIKQPERVEAADAETIRKLLTLHVRKDRFCEGHLASMFEERHITALLHRLRQLRTEMERKAQ